MNGTSKPDFDPDPGSEPRSRMRARRELAIGARALMRRVVAADVLPLRSESDHAPVAIELQ